MVNHTLKRQGTLALEHHPTVLSSRLVSATARFSLRASDIEELLTQHDEDYLMSQCDLVNRRIESAPAGAIASPRAYFQGCRRELGRRPA